MAHRIESSETRLLLAATLAVTTTADTVDAGDGVVSLREALATAQASQGVDELIQFSPTILDASGKAIIHLDAALGQLSYLGDDGNGNSAGALTINGDVDGDGLADITLDADRTLGNAGNNTRVFSADRVHSLTLNGLILREGATTNTTGGSAAFLQTFGLAGDSITIHNSQFIDSIGPGASDQDSFGVGTGGLFINIQRGTLVMTGSVVSGITAGYAMTIQGDTTSMTLQGNRISGNTAGGVRILNEDAPLLFTDNVLSGNSNSNGSAGLYLNIGGSTVTVTGNQFIGNTSGTSNAAFGMNANNDALNLSNNLFQENSSGSDKPIGISSSGSQVTISGNTIIRNSAGEYTGAMGLYLDDATTANIIGNLISENSSGAYYGSVVITTVAGSTALLANNTIAKNTAVYTAGLFINGDDGSIRFVNNTIVGNRASADDGGIIVAMQGIVFDNNLIAGNTANNLPSDVRGAALAAGSSNNLIGDAANAGGLVNGVNGNIVGVDWTTVVETVAGPGGTTLPLLADHGGRTLTVALAVGSPALNAGQNAKAVDNSSNPLPSDGRGTGFARIASTTVDIGAYEQFTQTNTAPLISNFSGTTTYVAGSPPIPVDDNATIADSDSVNFDAGQLIVSISTNSQATDVLSIINQGNGPGQIAVAGAWVTFGGVSIGTVTGGTNGDPLTVSLNAQATPAAVQALLRQLGFSSTAAVPSTLTRTVKVTVSDGDGSTSIARAKAVAVAAANTAPIIAGFSDPAAYTENGPGLILDSDVTLTDGDSANFSGGTLTVQLTVNAVSSDLLAIRNQGTGANQVGVSGSNVTCGGIVIGSFAGGTETAPLVITFNSQATPAIVQRLLRNITYRNLSDNPFTAPRTVQVVVTDGDGGTSNAVTKTISVTATNDAPVLGGISGSLNYTENSVPPAIAPSGTVSDVDSADFSTGKLTVNLTANGQSTDVLGIINQGTAAGQIGVSGNNVSFGGGVIGTFTGGTNKVGLTITFNASATPTAVQALLRKISFSVTSDTPVTTARTVQFKLSDGDGGTSAALTKTINVAAGNDAPIVNGFDGTVDYLGGAAVIIDSNATVTDPDSTNFDGGKLTVNLTANGEAADVLTVRNQGTGAGQIGVSGTDVTFGGVVIGTMTGGTSKVGLTINFNANATIAATQTLLRNITFSNGAATRSTAPRTVRVLINDGDGGLSTAVTKTITVAPGNAAPVVAAFDGNVNYSTGGSAVILDSDATVGDADSANFDTGKLTVSLTANGQLTDVLAVRNQGIAAGQIGVSGNNVTFGGVVIGTVTGGTNRVGLTVTFNANATPAATQALLRNITFSSTSGTPVTTARTARVIIADGDGGTSAAVTKTISFV